MAGAYKRYASTPKLKVAFEDADGSVKVLSRQKAREQFNRIKMCKL